MIMKKTKIVIVPHLLRKKTMHTMYIGEVVNVWKK